MFGLLVEKIVWSEVKQGLLINHMGAFSLSYILKVGYPDWDWRFPYNSRRSFPEHQLSRIPLVLQGGLGSAFCVSSK